MPRYIDADRFEVVTAQRHSEDFIDGMDYILEMIDNAPTEDVVARAEYDRMCRIAELRKKDHDDTCDLLFKAEALCKKLGIEYYIKDSLREEMNK